MEDSRTGTISSAEPVDFEPATDRAGRIETHGADYIPDAERHGHPRSLFAVWAASNVTYLNIILGGTMILLGLNVWQSLAVVVAGNLFWILAGYVSVSGPAAGTPSEVITRVMFGIRGNRVVNLTIGWLVGVAYEAINLSVGALAGFALIERWDPKLSFGIKLAVVLIIAVVTFTISVYGHATIVKLSGPFTWVLSACIVVLAIFIFQHANFGYETPAKYATHGWALWAVAAIGFTIIASSPLSWGSSADFSRYLPRTASRAGIIWWTAMGGFIPSVALGALGVFAGTVVDMTDPQSSLKALLPGWFYPIFLLVIIVGSVTNNVLTAYSTGLALLAAGIPWKRSRTVIFDAAIAVAITCYGLFISNFFDSLNNILELTVPLLGPALGIYIVDMILRKNDYDGRKLQDDARGGAMWFSGGFKPAGVVALLVGAAVALLCVDTDVYVGPIATALDGADFSAIVGPIIGGVLYAVMSKSRMRKELFADAGIPA